MKAAEMKPVLLGHVREVRERHPTPAHARRARATASVVLRGLKDRTFHGLFAEKASSVEVLNSAHMYVDPNDPCVVVCSCDPKPAVPSIYRPVLDLAVWASCDLELSNTTFNSVVAKLKAMATEAEEVLGTRPTWHVTWVSPKVFNVVRWPDDHDPVVGGPRERLTGARRKKQLEDLDRMEVLRINYEYCDIYWATLHGRPYPPIPKELADLMTKYAPLELDSLRRRVAEGEMGPDDVMAQLRAERLAEEQESD